MATILETTFASYSLGEQIGQGGVGRVFAATDTSGEEWAVKLLDSHSATGERRKRFKNEIEFAQRNRHPNLISVHDHGSHQTKNGPVPFYVMPRLSGSLRTFSQSIKTGTDRIRYFGQILDGIEAAHLLGVVHRDLKPENILYNSKADSLVIADFGIAHFTDEEIYTLVDTSPAARLANFQYAAPEQRMRGSPVGKSADIYALGLVLNELFTGVIPHGTEYLQIGSVDSAFRWLDPLVASMLIQDPARRIHDSAGVKRTLIAYQSAEVTRQRLSELTNTVVPTTAVEDPLAETPPSIIGAEWLGGVLKLTLDQPVPEKWRWALLNMGNYSSVYNAGPEKFSFRGNLVTIPSQDSDAQRIIDSFISWLPRVTAVYKDRLRRDRREEEDRVRDAIRKERDELERRQRINSSLKI